MPAYGSASPERTDPGKCYEINKGIPDLKRDATFQVKAVSKETFAEMLLRDYDKDRSQVICPIKEGPISCASINKLIQGHFNRNARIVVVYGKRIFRLYDRIIMTKTNYEKGYINGDIGYIKDSTATGEILVTFPEGDLYLDKEDYCYMELAYAITIHKSEGQ